MRVLLASTGGAGHVGPLLPVLSVLVRRGDEVLLVVPPALAGTAGGTGQPYVLGEDPPQAELEPLWERFAVADPTEQAVLANRELFGRLCTTAMLPTLQAAFARFRPDLVVREPCEYASAIVAEAGGVRHVQVAIGLAEVEAAGLELAAPVLRTFRPDLPERLLAAPYLTRLPAAVDPSPFPTTLRIRDPNPGEPPWPLPDWWAGSTDPLVYLTLGTVAGSLPEATEVYRAALAAVDGLPVRVLMTLGRDGDASSLGTVPANVHVEKWVPQRDVLAQVAVVLCHGGSGTVFGALEVGVPLVVVPLFADQPANGRLIAQAGAGLVSGRSADQLRQALLRVLHDDAYRQQAASLGQAMQSQPELPDVLDDLERGGMLKLGDAIAYRGPEDSTHVIYEGHPGRVVDLGQFPPEIAVSFVAGTPCGLRAEGVVPISEAEYFARGHRLVQGLHPLEDRQVPRYTAPGHEWPDGRGAVPPP